MIPGDPQWLAERGIDPSVFAERGVERYDAGDADKVLAAVTPFLRPKPGKDPERSLTGRINWVKRVVAQSGGLVLPKTAPPGWEVEPGPVPPQLRPDIAVVTDPRPRPYHFHGRLDDQPLTQKGRHRWPRTPKGKALLHQDVLYPDNESVLSHIKKHHGGVNTQEVHRHDSAPAKYLFLPGSDEARIDLHRRAARMLADADRVFLVLEGVLKNDAVLSAGEAVFSVPSVTLWEPEELWHFAKRYLEGTMVFVVPDADWIDNPMVDWQALLVRTHLREALGDHMVYIAAPPVEFFEAMKREGVSDTAKGVDDWLGTHGRTWAARNAITPGIDGLVIRGKEPGREVLRTGAWGKEQHALTLLSLLGPKHDRSLGSLASVMGVASSGYPERALPVLESLAERRAVKIAGSLDWTRYEYEHVDRETGEGKIIQRKDWEERPVIEMQDGFEAYEAPRTLLGDFWTREAYAVAKEAREEARENARRLREIEARLDDQDDGSDEGRHLRRVR